MNLVRRAASAVGVNPRKPMALGSGPFDAAGRGRRGLGWSSTPLGINTLMMSHGQELLQRNRDSVRNSAWAASAIDSYAANSVGRGIALIQQHPDETTRKLITNKWERWIKESDVEYDPSNPASGQTDFNGQQMISARETMEAGECFVRFRPRSLNEGLTVPLQLQLIEAEQLPIWGMSQPSGKNQVRCGIEFRPDGRRAAYHFLQCHPGETMFFPMESLTIERVPAADILHLYKPIRAGQLRGMPWMTPVLAKLYSLDKYMDSEMFRKEVSSTITGFIKQALPNDPIFQRDGTVNQPVDLSEQISRLEPGSFPVLNFGEEVQFADIKDSGDYASVIRTGLQAFASGVGLSEYQVSGNLEGISYSSIRAGLLEFRRKCEQFQHSVFIFQFCHPVYRRWLKEAMLALVFGVELLNQYNEDRTPFEDVRWVTPGWPWVDPEKEIKAFERANRDGYASRSSICASQGLDSSDIDAQQQVDNKRADEMGLSYDGDGRKVLAGKNAGLTEEEILEDTQKGVQP